MTERNKLHDLAVLDELLICDAENGKLYWRYREQKWFASERSRKSWNSKYAWEEAFTNIGTHGYCVSTIHWVHYSAHRVIWAMHYRQEPPRYIDHINGDKCDNRIANLQSVSAAQNIMKARKSSKAKHSQYKGVTYSVRDKRWLATGMCNGKRFDLGRHATEGAAASAYNSFALSHFGKFATMNEVAAP